MVQFARKPADAHAQPLAGQLDGRERHRAIERYQTGRATHIRRWPPHFLDQALGLQVKQDARQARL